MNRLDPVAIAVIGLAGGLVIGVLLGWAWKWYRARRARLAIVATVAGIGIEHVRDQLVPDGNGGVLHLDFAVLTPRGIVVVDLRDVEGNVFGSEQMAEWTVMDGAQRHTFPNPLNQLYDRIAAVKAAAGSIPVEGRIVFTPRASFPKGLPRLSLGLESLPVEFPLGERAVAERAAATYREDWQRFRAQLAPSPLVKS